MYSIINDNNGHQKKNIFLKEILKWGEENFKNYPWRLEQNPYKIFIAEILLGRTKAHQVVPVFKKIMKEYPTLKKFLEINSNKVRDFFKSLGLIKRSEFVIEMILRIKIDFNSQIPYTFSELISLKGIGRYSANAILCFGFSQRRPLLDTNFIRIYERVFKIKAKTKTPKSDKFLWEFSEYLLPKKNFIKFNYAILDLGGNVCISKKAKCLECPLKVICIYFKENRKN